MMCLCLVEFLLFERAATKGGNLMLSPRDMISHGSGVGSVTYRKKTPDNNRRRGVQLLAPIFAFTTLRVTVTLG